MVLLYGCFIAAVLSTKHQYISGPPQKDMFKGLTLTANVCCEIKISNLEIIKCVFAHEFVEEGEHLSLCDLILWLHSGYQQRHTVAYTELNVSLLSQLVHDKGIVSEPKSGRNMFNRCWMSLLWGLEFVWRAALCTNCYTRGNQNTGSTSVRLAHCANKIRNLRVLSS